MLRLFLHMKISSFLLHCGQLLPPVLSFPSLVLYDRGGMRIGDRNRQVFRCVYVWHAHTACVHHREETILTAATPWPWLHYLLVWCWRSGESPASKTKYLFDTGTKRIILQNVLWVWIYLTMQISLLRNVAFTYLDIDRNFTECWPICDIYKYFGLLTSTMA